MERYKNCKICPRECGIDRTINKGVCGATDKLKVALVSTHNFEEPCISGKEGSGTIFFSNCNLRCVYCQNYEISRDGYGKEISIERLADIMIEQQERGVNNINLVTPTMYVDSIIEAIKIAKSKGLTIPIVYNSSGYEKSETIDKLKGYIDIYLPDFKYATDRLAKRYSGIDNYVINAKESIAKMIMQVGKPVFNDKGILKSGVVIRHMILPNNVLNTKSVLKYIADNFKDKALVSVMAQYFPTGEAIKDYPEINRKITEEELEEVEKYLEELNIENGYIQELGEHEEEYVPNFNLDNV